MRRVSTVLLVAIPLAAADLWLKATEPTEPWAYHDRSIGWLLLSICLLAGIVLVTRIPSLLVPPAAGILAGGILGNTLSAAWNGMSVPNPLIVAGGSETLAFNLADVWAVLGILLLTTSIGLWLVRNRELLPSPAALQGSWSRTVRRRDD